MFDYQNFKKEIGGDRECIYLNEKWVVKRTKRLVENIHFAILDDYLFEYKHQTLLEGEALTYIQTYAPPEVQKFFPRLKEFGQMPCMKATYSDVKLQEIYGYIGGVSTQLSDLCSFSQARIYTEPYLVMERVIPFETLPMPYQKKFFKKGSGFMDFVLDNGATKEELDILSEWLYANIAKENLKWLDYQYTPSNWGLRQETEFPVILDLGYFIFTKSGIGV